MDGIRGDIESFYTKFYWKLYKKQYFFTDADYGRVDRFLEVVSDYINLHSIGRRWLYYYFVFQFQYWYGLDIEAFADKKIKLILVLGKKAVDRYFNRDQSFDFTLDSCDFVNDFVVKKSEFLEVDSDTYIESKARYIEDSCRKKHLNDGERGLAFCLEHTSLYDPMSVFCIRCREKDACKTLLKENNFNLYNKRISR